MSALYLEVALKGGLLLFLLGRRLCGWREDRRAEAWALLERVADWRPRVHVFSFKEGSLLPWMTERRQRRLLERCVRKGWIRREGVAPFRPGDPPAWHSLWLTPKGRAALAGFKDEPMSAVPQARLLPRPS